MKTGLILEGGAMRGMFTAGVMDVMMEQGLRFDGAVGVSAGAAFGCNYKSHQIGRVIRYNTKYCQDRRYCGVRSLLTTGNIYSTDYCYGEVPLKRDVFDFETYRNDPMEFYVVCTDIVSGEAVYHKYEGTEPSGFDWIRASASMPLVSQIVEIDGRKLLDGGMVDSIPIKFFEGLGYDKNIVVLTQPLGFVKQKNRLMPMIRVQYRHYPKMVEAMAHRHILYNETLRYLAHREQAGKVLVLRPAHKLPVHRVERDPDKLRAAYEMGRTTTAARMGEIKTYLS
jgi:predicted patatin/cPLA2 family phospholipase